MTLLDDIDALTEQYAQYVASGVYPDEAIGTTPPTPTDWGSDLDGWQDITPEGRELAGDDPMVVINRLLRRITTPTGALPDDDDPETKEWGIDIREFLNRGSTPRQVQAFASMIESELSKEDEIDTVTANMALIRGEVDSLIVNLSGSLKLPNVLQPFSLVLSVTSASVLIKAIST